MLRFKPFIISTFMLLFSETNAIENVFLCYGKVPIDKIVNYKYVIIEEANYTKEEVIQLKQQNQLVICYISLAEMGKHASYFNEALPYTLLGRNPNWGSYYLDISKQELQEILIKNITEKFAKGFDGLFLDNIDNYGRYGKQKDLKEDFLHFLKRIRNQFGTTYFMQNAGLDLVSETNSLVDSIAKESVVSDYDFNEEDYRLRDKHISKSIIRKINYLEDKYKLPFVIIEYADTKKMYKKIKNRFKKHNWSFFVGQIDLQKLPIFN